MESDIIDVHGYRKSFDAALESLHKNELGISSKNISFIHEFARDCLLGKTVLKRAKKRISVGRVLKYVGSLKQIAYWLQTDFDCVTQTQMESFINKLDCNELDYFDYHGNLVRKKYSSWSRYDYKVTIRKFYKWLLGNDHDYPPIVRWIDTYVEDVEIPAISLNDVNRMVAYADSPRNKALIMILFESGARIGELMNVRLRHIEDKGDHLLVRFPVSKTFPRTLLLFKCRSYLADWLVEHPSTLDENSLLFPMQYGAVRKTTLTLGKRYLNRRVTPHILRHSCATYLAGKKSADINCANGWAGQ